MKGRKRLVLIIMIGVILFVFGCQTQNQAMSPEVTVSSQQDVKVGTVMENKIENNMVKTNGNAAVNPTTKTSKNNVVQTERNTTTNNDKVDKIDKDNMAKTNKVNGIVEIRGSKESNTKQDVDEYKILIKRDEKKLYLYKGGKVVSVYPVAVGKPSTPTPSGEFRVIEKVVNPAWTNPENGKTIPSGSPSNPLGVRWMRIGGNYGIHGTNNPSSIGTAASGGCIRMYNEDVVKLFDVVPMGTKVIIE